MNNWLRFFRFRDYSLRTKLLVAFIGVTLVAVGVLAAYVFRSTTSILRSGLEGELTEHTDEAALRIGTLLDEQIDLLKVLAGNEVLEQTAEALKESYTGDAAAIQTELNIRDTQWRAADASDNDNDPLVQER